MLSQSVPKSKSEKEKEEKEKEEKPDILGFFSSKQ